MEEEILRHLRHIGRTLAAHGALLEYIATHEQTTDDDAEVTALAQKLRESRDKLQAALDASPAP